MINITHIRIELPSEVNKKVDITTEETPEELKRAIVDTLANMGITASVQIVSREMRATQYTERTLRPHIGKKVKTVYGDGELLETREDETWVVNDSVTIKSDNGRKITIPASQVLEIVEE